MKYVMLSISALALLCLGAPMFAANTGQADVPFVATVSNPCNGELVDVNGIVHIDGTITVNRNNAHFTSHANPQGLTGVGEITGATYHATGVTRQDENISLTNGSANLTFINRFDFIGQGSVPNFEIHETEHITVNANGTLTVFFDKFTTTCH